MTSFLYPYQEKSISIDSKLAHNYILTIQYSLDGLSFVVFDSAEQKFICLKSYRFSEKNISIENIISELEEKENWKIKDFSQVNFLIDDNSNTLVPKDFFKEEDKNHYLSILNLTKEKVMSDVLSKTDAVNVYASEIDLETSLSKYIDNINIRHTSSILIDSLIKEFSSRKQETRAVVNVKNNSYELTVIKDDMLVFHNYFNFNTKEDFLYFILFTFEQLNIDNETTPLYFMGFIEEKSSVVELCSRYIRNIRFFNRNNELNYINELNSIPYYYYYILYNSVSCE